MQGNSKHPWRAYRPGKGYFQAARGPQVPPPIIPPTRQEIEDFVAHKNGQIFEKSRRMVDE